MPLSWDEFRQSGFDKSLYRDDLPIGTHLVTLDQLAWGQGNSAGVHLFFTTDAGEKFWSFIKWWGNSPEYVRFKEATPNEKFSIEIGTRIKSGKPFIKSASKV